jgi:anti-sigma factor ChrR (cupin superfamily)
MYQITVRESELPWADLGMPGVSMKVLHKDEATGAMAVLTRIEARAGIPAHWHSKADETVFVLDGDFVEAGGSYGPGSYFVGKAHTRHGPHSTVRGCTVLTHFSAELDFQTGPLPPEA